MNVYGALCKWFFTVPYLFCLVMAMPSFAWAESRFIFWDAPFPSSHASTIVELRNGELMSAWYGGSAEGNPDVAIWGARTVKGKWTMPFEIVREPEIACWNPVLFYTPDGRLWLYYKFGPSPSTWTGGRLFSADNGGTWSSVTHLPAGVYGPIRTKPLVLADGTIVSGSSVESYRSRAVWIERSTDGGETWKKVGPITAPPKSKWLGASEIVEKDASVGILQPSIISLRGGHLRLYARPTSQIGRICMADSLDSGVTWTDVRMLKLPNPGSGIDAIKLRDGRILIAYNDSLDSRSPLNLAISANGEDFQMVRTLESETGEFSYPAIIQAHDGSVYITYTWNRQRIAYIKLSLAELSRDQSKSHGKR